MQVSINIPAADESEPAAIRVEQVRSLYANTPAAVAGNVLIASILAYMQWSVIAASSVIAWLALMVIALGVRMLLFVVQRRAAPAGDDGVWLQRFRISIAAVGVAWGLASLLMFPANDIPHQAFLTFALGGVTSAAMTTLSIDRVSLLAFIVPALAAVIVRLFVEGTAIQTAMAVMVMLFLWFTVMISQRTYRTLRENVLLRISIAKREQELSSLVESTPDNIIRYDLDCRAVYINHMLERTVNVASGSLIGKTPMESKFAGLIGVEDYQAKLQQVIDTGESLDVEVMAPSPDGDLRTHHVCFVAERGSDGIIVGALAFGRDITEHKSAERVLQENVQHTQAILDNVADGIITIDRWGTVQSINLAGESIFGYAADEVIGRNVKMLMPEPYHSEHDGYLKNYHASGIPRIIGSGREVEGLRKDGSVFPMDLAVSRSSHNGQPLFIGLVRDITERKRVDKMKTEFVSTVSHELRTPLTAIAGALGLLVGGALGELPGQAKQMLDIAHKNSQRLSHLINDLLDMEKLVAGKMHFDLQVQPLMPLIEQTLETIQAYGEQYQVSFELIERVDDVQVRADGMRLQQVLSNFLSNAAKFSPVGGHVNIVVRRRKSSVQVDVIDQGSGIPEEFRSRIFQKFSQADSSDTRQKGGTGLGLAISKELIEQMNGTIGFESQEGQGSCFRFELPVWQANKAEQQPVEITDLKASRLLVVEDNQDIAQLLSVMLHRAGYQVDVALDSEIALDFLDNNEYAAMMLDLMLPGESGASLIRRIRSRTETEALPIVVVSAFIEDGRLAINGDFNVIDWLAKPFDEVGLVAAVRRALPDYAACKSRALYVEDDADLHHIVATIGREVADFDIAATLFEARSKLAQEHYGLVILDIGLPDGSGLELLTDLKRLNPEPPVIVLSGSRLTGGEQAKMQSALVKMRIPNQDLLDTLKRLLAVKSLD